MALATTCPQCKTSFKVIPDQLKLRRGLVRCGVCQHVFSGIDYLRYVDDSARARQRSGASGGAASSGAAGSAGGAGAAASTVGAQRKSSGPGAGSGSPQTVIAAEEDLKTAFFLSDSTFGPFSQTRTEDVVPPPSIVARDGTGQGAGGYPGSSGMAGMGGMAASGSGRVASALREAGGSPALRRVGADAPEPPPPSRRHRSRKSVLAPPDDDQDVAAANLLARQAREAYRASSGGRRSGRSHAPSRWQGYGDDEGPDESFAAFIADPRRRYALVALLVLAVLQLTLLFRSEIASRVPALRPVVALVAGVFGMNVDAVRSLASLSIESFELQATGREDHLSLNAVLRNKGNPTVRWPAMELTLTDQAGGVVVRKVILPSDYLNRSASREGLAARSEWPIRINLDPGGIELAGYSVSLFYP